VTALLFIPVKVVGLDDPRTQLQTRLTPAVCLQSNLEDETSKNPSKKTKIISDRKNLDYSRISVFRAGRKLLKSL